MIRDFITSAILKKNTVMFITSAVFIAGIASYFNGCEIVVAAFLTLIGLLLIKKNNMSYKFILLWLCIFYFGFFNAYFRIRSTDELAGIAPLNGEITGQIISVPNSNVRDKTKFFMMVNTVDGQKIRAKTFVNIQDKDGDFSMFNVGNVYKINGKLRLPFKAGNPSQFDYGKYLRNFNAFTIVYADKSDCELVKSELTLKWKFLQALNNTRNRIIKVHSQYLKSPNLEILGGIIFGDDAIAPPDYIKDSFTNSGLLHILAASGMNVAFIYGFWFYILSLLRVPYKPRVVSGMGIIILYTLMTGLGASVIRAALMLIFVLIGKLIDRDSHSVALLSFVAFLMLLYNPAFLNDVGFQLSFLVTFGIITTANVILEKVKGNKFREFLIGLFVIPIVAQVWVIPLQMFYFNTITTYSFFANVGIMPFLSVISFGGFVASVLSVFAPVANFVCRVFDFILNIMLTVLVNISDFFASLPNSTIETIHLSVFQVFIYYLVVLFITLMFREYFTKKHIVILVILVMIFFLGGLHIPNGKLDVIAFDVGNADSFLIKTPEEKYIIIDTGKSGYNGGKSQAEVIVRKYLKDRGVKNLECLIVTHFDNDHSGGTVDFIKNMKIKKLYVNSISDKSLSANRIYKTAFANSVNLVLAEDDSVIYKEDDLTLKTFVHSFEDDNESSIITLLIYKDFEILFTGDTGIKAFNRISNKLPAKVEVLKVGHHGANNVVDENYIKRISPEVSIISTGPNNYGHPNKLTLDILRNTEIYRTDKNNAIKISTDGEEYSLFTFNTSSKRFEFISSKTVH